MFVCGKTALKGTKTQKCSQLKSELKRLKRQDIIHVLEEQIKVKAINRVLELHGRHYMQIRINRADITSDNTLTLKICFNTSEEVRKYQKLIVAGSLFADHVVLFHSLDKHFRAVQRILVDAVPTKTIKYEPIGRQFEINKEISIHRIENVMESLHQQLEGDEQYKLELLRLSNCHLQEGHVYAMQHLLKYVEKIDLTGNDHIPPKAFHILSNNLFGSKVSSIKSLNLSSCNLTDHHLVDLQPALYLVETLDLSYNEELTPMAMKIITSSIHVANLTNSTKHFLQHLVLAGCNLQDGHVKQLYRCINVLHSLDLSGNTCMTSEAMGVIAEAVGNPENALPEGLKVLRLENCMIADHHLQKLSSCIHLLEELDLSWNVLSVNSLHILNSSIADNGAPNCLLKKLNISGCELSDEHFVQLTGCVTRITELHAGYNKDLTSKSLEMLCEQLKISSETTASTLTYLDVSSIDVEEDMLEILLACCKQKLAILDVSSCKLNDRHIEKSQLSFPMLTELHLFDNPTLTEYALKVISDVIVSRKENDEPVLLRYLNLSKCQLTDKHMDYLQPCLRYLTTLDISFNPILTPNAMKSLRKAFTDDGTKSSSLEELRIASCGFKDSHVVNLADCFGRLKKLDISANNLTFISLLAIQNELVEKKRNKHTIELELLNVYQAFCLREYHYRQFEIDLKALGVKVISVV